MALRFGWTTFPITTRSRPISTRRHWGSLQAFINQITVQKFPQVRIRGYDNEGRTLGAIEPTEIT
jgi:hypothetical protein